VDHKLKLFARKVSREVSIFAIQTHLSTNKKFTKCVLQVDLKLEKKIVFSKDLLKTAKFSGLLAPTMRWGLQVILK